MDGEIARERMIGFVTFVSTEYCINSFLSVDIQPRKYGAGSLTAKRRRSSLRTADERRSSLVSTCS